MVACALAACASQQQGPFFDDEKYLVVGVDPDAEARSLSAQMEKTGFHVLSRLRGKTFTALGFGDAHDLPVKVRIITVRGIELALDPVVATPLQVGVRYELLAAPVRGTQDPDNDGFEEAFVALRSDDAEASCIQVYRIRDSGFVDAIDGKSFTRQDLWQELPLCELGSESAPEPEAPAAEPEPQSEPRPEPKPKPEPKPAAEPGSDKPVGSIRRTQRIGYSACGETRRTLDSA